MGCGQCVIVGGIVVYLGCVDFGQDVVIFVGCEYQVCGEIGIECFGIVVENVVFLVFVDFVLQLQVQDFVGDWVIDVELVLVGVV